MKKNKGDIRQEPAYQELVKLLRGMETDRREALETAIQDMAAEDAKNYYSVKEAAARLGMTPAGVRLWAQQGKLDARRFGSRWRISAADVERIIRDAEFTDSTGNE